MNAPQRTDGWFAERLGKVTASRIGDLMARTKSGPSASRANYMAQLICERLTGTKEEGFISQAMAHGIECEADARSAYEFMTDASVVECGFVPHPTLAMAGASPDGLVGFDGLIEIKCPNTATHIETLTGAPIDAKYVKQMQFQMACCEAQWCDFVSFDPRLPPEMRVHIQRVERDDQMIAEIEAAVVEFLAELDAKMAVLTEKYGKAA